MAKPLHILFVCSWYPHPGNPGNGIFIRRHAECLATTHQVTVVFARSSELVTQEDITITQTGNLREIICLYPKPKANIPFVSAFIKLNAYCNHLNNALRKAFSGPAFDLVNLQVIFPAAIPVLGFLKKSKLPLLITEHWSGYYPEDGNYKGFYLSYITKKITRKAKAVLVISEKLKSSMLAHHLHSNYEVINNVVDTAVFRPATPRAQNDQLKILHVSSLVEREKNISGIIDTARLLKEAKKDFSLTILGGTAESVDAYRKSVSEKGLSGHITFMGQKTPVEVAEQMNKSDVFLLLSHFEGMPVVVLEAMACGLPVISSNVGAVPAMVDVKKGIVLPDNTARVCADALLSFNRQAFESSEAMHQAIEAQYGYEPVCRRITTIYERVLKSC